MTFYEKITNPRVPFVIAEIGSNHNGNMDLAKEMIDAAKEAGCDAVKFQSWDWDTLFSKNIMENKKDMVAGDVDAVGLESIQKKLALSEEDHRLLKNYCDEKGIIFSSTAFSHEGADLLAELNVPFIKIASIDITNYPLLRHVAKKKLPVILSIGMGTEEEIKGAIEIFQEEGNEELVVLHCVSVYPPKDEIVNLRTMEWLRETFNVPVGYSDHTLGINVPLASVAMGACVVEKHFILDEKDGRDLKVSLKPAEMKEMVDGVKQVAACLGEKSRVLCEEELESRKNMCRSVVTKENMKAGDIIDESKIVFKRPGVGIPPYRVNEVIGRKLKVDKGVEELIELEDLESV